MASDVVGLPCACAEARRTARALTQMYDRWLRPAAIEGPQFSLLATLDRHGPTTQAAVGRLFGVDKTTLSRNLQLLKRKGWITAAPGTSARERRVRLTAEGRRRLAAARPAWRKAQAELRSSLGPEEWDAMWRVFRTITSAAQTARRPKPKIASMQ